jgi:hypothetical protein
MTSTRLRRAFIYPDEDENEPTDGIDEEGQRLVAQINRKANQAAEQEKVIATLTAQDAARTAFFIVSRVLNVLGGCADLSGRKRSWRSHSSLSPSTSRPSSIRPRLIPPL